MFCEASFISAFICHWNIFVKHWSLKIFSQGRACIFQCQQTWTVARWKRSWVLSRGALSHLGASAHPHSHSHGKTEISDLSPSSPLEPFWETMLMLTNICTGNTCPDAFYGFSAQIQPFSAGCCNAHIFGYKIKTAIVFKITAVGTYLTEEFEEPHQK